MRINYDDDDDDDDDVHIRQKSVPCYLHYHVSRSKSEQCYVH
jgi:hypothetical protein